MFTIDHYRIYVGLCENSEPQIPLKFCSSLNQFNQMKLLQHGCQSRIHIPHIPIYCWWNPHDIAWDSHWAGWFNPNSSSYRSPFFCWPYLLKSQAKSKFSWVKHDLPILFPINHHFPWSPMFHGQTMRIFHGHLTTWKSHPNCTKDLP